MVVTVETPCMASLLKAIAFLLPASHRRFALRAFSAPTSRSAKLFISFLIDEKYTNLHFSSINCPFANGEKEVDFIVQKSNNEREYYQVSYTINDEKVFEREISSFRNIKDNYPKFLLTLDYDNIIIDCIQKINIIDWLLK